MSYRAFLVSGFLGSGKTTFILENLLPWLKGEQVSILVNDYGEINFDKLKYYEKRLQVLGIEGSCICCTAGEAFLNALQEVKKLSPTVIVETSGVSEIDPIYEALESEGFTVEVVFTTLNLDLPENLFTSPLVQSLIFSSQILILTKADLISPREVTRKISYITPYKKPYFIAYEGKIRENLEELLLIKSDKAKGHLHLPYNPFYRDTLKLKGFYSREDIEGFLKRLPSEIYRVKGVISCVESPVPLALNFSFGYISWEKMETTTSNFLVFIGVVDPRPFFKDFPPPVKGTKKFERKMFPIKGFDRRNGIAYFNGEVVSELNALERLYSLIQEAKAPLFITKDKRALNSKLRERALTFRSFEYSRLLKLRERIEAYPDDIVICFDLPSGLVSWFIEKIPHKKFLHFGEEYLLPSAYLSLKINSIEKKRALLDLFEEGLYKLRIDSQDGDEGI